MAGAVDTAGLVEDGRNSRQVVCIRCKAKILPPKMGSYEVIPLPPTT
jgi:hypothetical protein